jgi:hypothetical protein
MVFASAPALAAPPEAGPVIVESITATTANLRGVLNPGKEGEAGTYEFLYNETAAKTGCEGGLKSKRGLSFGMQGEEVREGSFGIGTKEPKFVPGLTGLEPNTKYTVCLLARSLGKGEQTVGLAVTFTTAFPPEAPEKAKATAITATAATLHGVLNSHSDHESEPGGDEFVYRQSASECQRENPETKQKESEKAITPTQAPKGHEAEAAEAEVTELLPGTTYTFCLLAHNNAGETALGQPETFTTLIIAPTIDAESASATEVNSDSATLHAEVHPNSTETTYHFEYGTTEAYGQSTPEQLLAAGADSSAEAHIQGLQAQTVYHYRVVATNSQSPAGGTPGPDQTFTTQQSGGSFLLPDNRAYEMVTPPQKQGALFRSITGFGETGGFGPKVAAVRASAGGSVIADVATAPSEPEPQGNLSPYLSVLSTRGPLGWSSQVIAPPHLAPGPTTPKGGEYLFFSEDLSQSIVQPLGNFTPLSPEATESTAYLRTDYLNGNVSERCEASRGSAASCFQPLVTAANDTASPLRPFGEANPNGECPTSPTSLSCGPRFEAGTPDLSHVVLSSPVQLTSTPIAPEPESNPNLYEFSGGRLQLLSIMPGSELGARSFLLAGSPLTPCVGAGGLAARHAISNDGEKVILEAHKPGPCEHLGLYLRDVAKGETVRLDVRQGEGTGASEEAEYMTASSDASRVFFLDRGRLTAQSSVSGPDLYEYNLNAPAGSRLTDLTVDPNVGESTHVTMVLGSSLDGSYVYFVAAGRLAPGAVNDGECGSGQGCNLYVRHGGVTRFVAQLSPEDRRDWQNGSSGLAEQPVRVSPHGRWLAFMSSQDLTGYDTRNAGSARPDQEVYLYDAISNNMRCASCNPTGARPLGFGKPGPIAALVPGWTEVESGGVAFYQSRYLSDSGRLFFDSYDALVPKDVNGTWDVYEYEPEGVPAGEHACASAVQSGSDVFKPGRAFEVEGRKSEEPAGCVGLISSGTSPEASTFLDASETGGDVFFLTTARLSTQDADTALDVYDAHECTAASPCTTTQVASSPCTTADSCRTAPTPQPPLFGAPASGTFSGPGNITPPPPPKKVTKKTVKCKKPKRASHGSCIKQKSKKAKKVKRAKRASNDRGAGR